MSPAPSTPLDVLRHYWGYDSFRACQAGIIDSVLAGKDTLGLMPTGGGKSITFQVPAMLLPGLTVVVTPLISLMKDQVDNLRERGIRAVYLAMGLTAREARLACDRCRLGKAKLLYVSPERLRSQSFIDELRTWNISLIVVDEAHCISQWGYDFRPSYLRIAELRKVVGETVPVLALTASATPEVRDDIRRSLGFADDAPTFQLSFDRPNLTYVVRSASDKLSKLLQVLGATQGSAIVYVRSRVRTREVAGALTAAGIDATWYHAGLDPRQKEDRQEQWKKGLVRVMVATNAFGMGIDKPDVRTVVHIETPPSLEEYYQEAGRAGRDGAPAYAVMLVSSSDKQKLSRMLADSFPPLDYVRRVYELVGNNLGVAVGEGYNSVFEFDVEKFCTTFRLQPGPVRGALAILTQAGYLDYSDMAGSRSRVFIDCDRHELYSFDLQPRDEAVLMALMRQYTGLFTDYVSIHERDLENATGLTPDETYEALLSLQRQGVLHYVPRRALPLISYPTSRELPKYLQFPPACYDDRRRIMEQRIEAVRRYAFSDSDCRSTTILRYFGEDDVSDCGRCDVCRERRRMTKVEENAARLPEILIELVRRYPGASVVDYARAAGIPGAVAANLFRDMHEQGRVALQGVTVKLL